MEISFPIFEWKQSVSLAPLIRLKMASYIYSNAITQQNERAWYCFGFKKEHDDKLGL